MRKLQHILSAIPLLLFVDFAHAGDKEDVLASWNALKDAWTVSYTHLTLPTSDLV